MFSHHYPYLNARLVEELEIVHHRHLARSVQWRALVTGLAGEQIAIICLLVVSRGAKQHTK